MGKNEAENVRRREIYQHYKRNDRRKRGKYEGKEDEETEELNENKDDNDTGRSECGDHKMILKEIMV